MLAPDPRVIMSRETQGVLSHSGMHATSFDLEQARDCFGTATGPSSKRRFRYVINQSVNEFHTQLAAAALARPPDTRTAPDGVRLCNGILLSIPDKEYDVVRPHLQQVSLSLGQSLTIPLKDSGMAIS